VQVPAARLPQLGPVRASLYAGSDYGDHANVETKAVWIAAGYRGPLAGLHRRRTSWTRT